MTVSGRSTRLLLKGYRAAKARTSHHRFRWNDPPHGDGTVGRCGRCGSVVRRSFEDWSARNRGLYDVTNALGPCDGTRAESRETGRRSSAGSPSKTHVGPSPRRPAPRDRVSLFPESALLRIRRHLAGGRLDLAPLRAFAALNPFPSGSGGQYSGLVRQLAEQIPKEAGWYLWGAFEAGAWKTIYVGKAEAQGGYSLADRIREELWDERICFWVDAVGLDEALRQKHEAYDGRYMGAHVAREARKSGSRFIVWVSSPGLLPEQVASEEAALIAHYKPHANIQRAPGRPSRLTGTIVSQFEAQIDSLQ